MHFLFQMYKKIPSITKVIGLFICLFIILSLFLVKNNHFLYNDSIIEVIETSNLSENLITDTLENHDILYTQQIEGIFKNGQHKGDIISLTNEFSSSQAMDQEYQVGDELFVELDSLNASTGHIIGVKRDYFLLLTSWLLVAVLLVVGKKQGLFSVVTLLANAFILSVALDYYIDGANVSLLWICAVSIVLFTVLSLVFVNGLNEKTYVAIIATLLGTFISLLITYLAFMATNGNGLRYEELQFITRPYETVFWAGVFLGSLGAVMDVSITMSSSLFALYEKDRQISIHALTKSGLAIGKDIMGTMTNILFFAYVSGSIPMLILYFKNALPFGYTLSLNLSLEMVRALSGGIGIVLTIPIGLYTALFFINRKKAKQ